MRDRVLLGALVVCGLLISYQVGVTLLHPAWIGQVTDWLRTALAWPELLIVVGVSLYLSRFHHPATWSWWMWSVALFSYAIARTLWTVYDQLIYHDGVPFPTFPDLFFVLQYPFFFLATILLPRTRFWGSRLILILDGVLVMGAATALSWHFILAPIYMASGITPLARSVSLAYPVGDLLVLFGLTMTLLRPSRYKADRLVLMVLVMAVISLIVADTWVGWLLLSPPYRYLTGHGPDIFWLAFYLLVPLAGLVQFRLIQCKHQWNNDLVVERPAAGNLQWSDFIASLRFFCPIVVALLASGTIVVNATMALAHVGWRHVIVPYTVSAGLLFLILARQEIAFLEVVQLRREAEFARANDLAMRELNRRKDEFLDIASHELKTPLTSLQGYMELLARRLTAWRPTEERADELARTVKIASIAIEDSEESLRRITQLVDDLLDDAHIRDGRLCLFLRPIELGTIIRKAVEDQRTHAPGRVIRLDMPTSMPVLVLADARRMEQVVTNYMTNALKYSKEGQPIEVALNMRDGVARVAVCDEGIGVPVSEQAHLWERFHVIEGNTVQSGSGVSLGIGLYICKSIIEGHSGQVGVDSAPGQGSTFWFTLPLLGPAT